MNADPSVQSLVDEFALQAKRHVDVGLEWNAKRIIQETGDRCTAIAQQLSSFQPSERKALSVLLDNPDTGVRFMAACYFVSVDREHAYSVLRELSDRCDGTEACIHAFMNLQAYEWGLEPF